MKETPTNANSRVVGEIGRLLKELIMKTPQGKHHTHHDAKFLLSYLLDFLHDDFEVYIASIAKILASSSLIRERKHLFLGEYVQGCGG